jgi:3-oxoadipate enol-lactonase
VRAGQRKCGGGPATSRYTRHDDNDWTGLKMQSASINGINIHYADDGESALPAMVFANSLGTDFRIWSDVAARFSGRFRTVRYDKRGHGLSDCPPAPYSINNHIDDLAGLLDRLGIESLVMVGVSVGGLIGTGLAARSPDRVRALVICDSMPRFGPPSMWDERIAAIRKGGIAALRDAILERWFPPGFRKNPQSGFAAYRNMLERMPVEGYIGTCTALRDADLTDEARALALPVMFVVGSNDGSTTPEAVRAAHTLVSGSRFEIIDGAGHLPNIEAPQKLFELISEFLRENDID